MSSCDYHVRWHKLAINKWMFLHSSKKFCSGLLHSCSTRSSKGLLTCKLQNFNLTEVNFQYCSVHAIVVKSFQRNCFQISTYSSWNMHVHVIRALKSQKEGAGRVVLLWAVITSSFSTSENDDHSQILGFSCCTQSQCFHLQTLHSLRKECMIAWLVRVITWNLCTTFQSLRLHAVLVID